MAKVLVTGGAGYMGSHTCKRLVQSGHEPIVYDNLCRVHAGFVKWGLLETGDILDSKRLVKVFERHRPNAVIHFAALAYVDESVQYPGLYYRNKVLGSLSLIESMLETGITRLVFSSTCATYGIPKKMPITEDTPLCPVNAYGRTKLAVERMLEDFDTAPYLRSVSLHYFNAVGADADGEIGEWHELETHAIPLAVQAALETDKTFRLFGADYQTPDGTAIRDYVHVNDLAAAHVAALEHLMNGGATTAVNLGTGQGTSAQEVIDAVEQITCRKISIRIAPRRPLDPPGLVADATRAQTLFDWHPDFTTIHAIVETAVR